MKLLRALPLSYSAIYSRPIAPVGFEPTTSCSSGNVVPSAFVTQTIAYHASISSIVGIVLRRDDKFRRV
jgi:hypothetical protein